MGGNREKFEIIVRFQICLSPLSDEYNPTVNNKTEVLILSPVLPQLSHCLNYNFGL